MMKMGRKGFMLAEVVVVSVVIATVLVTLFTGLSRVSSAYETRNRYYDVDSLYIAMEINDILRKNTPSTINTTIAMKLSGDSNIDSYEEFYKNTGSSINSYITPYDKNKMLSLKDLNSNITFSNYLDYLSNNLDFSDEKYNYIIIVERIENGNIDDCYYYALKLKY